jgi:hypothetical protein
MILSRRPVALLISLAAVAGLAAAAWAWLSRPNPFGGGEHVLDVHPGDDIQSALEAAAGLTGKRTVRVHAGTYRPAAPGQALVYFNARHDGITLAAVGDVTLTAANPDVAAPQAPSYPAVVNHVVYFGDGVSRRTVLRGFRVTGANGFVQGPGELIPIRSAEDLDRAQKYTTAAPSPIESGAELPKTQYFFTDGGGILVYGRSFPTIENVTITGNYGCVCGAGLSVQHHKTLGTRDSVLCRNCEFRDNRTAVSGSAVDLLTPGSRAVFENCLFVGNVSNATVDANGRSGYGALTVFPFCRAEVRHCTFTDNNAGVDDRGERSSYVNCIFWNNRRPGGTNPRPRFELDITDAGGVTGCFIHGEVNDLQANVSTSASRFDPPDPDFDADYRPRNPLYQSAGYRPVNGGSK